MKTRPYNTLFPLFLFLFAAFLSSCDDVNTIDNTFTYVATDNRSFSLEQVPSGKDTTISVLVTLDTNTLFRDQKTSPEHLKTAKLTKFAITSADSGFALSNFSNIRVTLVADTLTPLEVINTSIPDTAFIRYVLPLTNTDVLPFVRRASFEIQITFTPNTDIIPLRNLGEETAISITAEPL